jgi:hypothetical protein
VSEARCWNAESFSAIAFRSARYAFSNEEALVSRCGVVCLDSPFQSNAAFSATGWRRLARDVLLTAACLPAWEADAAA